MSGTATPLGDTSVQSGMMLAVRMGTLSALALSRVVTSAHSTSATDQRFRRTMRLRSLSLLCVQCSVWKKVSLANEDLSLNSRNSQPAASSPPQI